MRTAARLGFTLVELLVVVSIIGLLVAITVPAVGAARESARAVQCKSNMHQFWIGMSTHADRTGRYCSGAFSWRFDGAVTEIGWVADQVEQGVLPGKMLCPSNLAQLNETYNDLLIGDISDPALFFSCGKKLEDEFGSKALGSSPVRNPDGSTKKNPCRKILEGGSVDRAKVVEEEIYNPGFNTNYAASWILVRSEPLLDKFGRLVGTGGCTPTSNLQRFSTLGPLNRARADTGSVALNTVPFLGCAAAARSRPVATQEEGATAGTTMFLSAKIGNNLPGQPFAASFTDGPVAKDTLLHPAFADDLPYASPDQDPATIDGWAEGWGRTLQDLRNFGAVHRGTCNIVFADGSVRTFVDENKDGFFNNGFDPSGTPATPASSGFKDGKLELPTNEVVSRWRLRED